MKTIKLNLILILGLILFTFAIISSASAVNTIYVNGTSGSDANDGTSWAHAKATIQNGTNTLSSGGNVYVANGIYKENLKINSSINLFGQSQSATIIDGNHSGSVINIAPIFISVGIKNFTIMNGDHTSYGGGILNPTSSLLIIECCNIISNRALADGGGIYNTASCYIYNSIITGNTAMRDGGGICNLGICYLYGTMIVSNTALDLGGGVYNFGLLFADRLTTIYNNQPDQIVGNDIIPYSSPGVGLNPPLNNSVSSSNISPNSKNPLVNAVSSSTIGMQKTGLPIAALIIAILALFGGLASSKRK